MVRQTAAGLADYLLATTPDARERGVVIGFDARHKSDRFADATARVFAAKGIRAMLFPSHCPTPVLAFAVLHLHAAAGVQVTASHNPPQDNGYKVYWGDGPQIVPPLDTGIAAAIDHVAAAKEPVVLASPDDPFIERVSDDVHDAYLAGVDGLDPRTSSPDARKRLHIVYTAMHGVGGETVQNVFARAGFTQLSVVDKQFEPDPDFPTVSFPNPEEPGALDLAFADATKHNADLILANDPDADRMAAAIPDATTSTGWRALRGDEIGWLLADHLLSTRKTPTNRGLVCTTLVSSSLLRSMAAAYDVDYVETLTGFKWLARAALARPDNEHVMSYEEALGYCVGSLVRDKDGISAALVFADLVASLHAKGETVATRLNDIEARFGRHDTEQWSLRFDGPTATADMAALMTRLREANPTAIAGVTVNEITDLATNEPPADVVVLRLADGTRITVRPSGTEPKCKVYFETVTRADAQAAKPKPIADLKRAMAELLHVPANS